MASKFLWIVFSCSVNASFSFIGLASILNELVCNCYICFCLILIGDCTSSLCILSLSFSFSIPTAKSGFFFFLGVSIDFSSVDFSMVIYFGSFTGELESLEPDLASLASDLTSLASLTSGVTSLTSLISGFASFGLAFASLVSFASDEAPFFSSALSLEIWLSLTSGLAFSFLTIVTESSSDGESFAVSSLLPGLFLTGDSSA